ncbi:MAG: LVIVD repeat-containing protein, partial [Sediminibacterium sp.]
TIENPGKIVLLGNYLFLNDVDKGIHIIDLSDITNPQKISFIHIPGCIDLAINGNILYADCYTDLVAIDIADPHRIEVKQFLNGVFPHRYYGSFAADTARVIQKWVKVDTTVKRDFRGNINGNNFEFMSGGLMSWSSFRSASATLAGTKAIGIAGSTARFGQQQQRLYTVSLDDLKVFNVTVPEAPVYVKEIGLNRGDIETIFPYQQNLFIGAQTGMYIYNASNPDNPQPLGQFVHTRACDPVIADGDYAFVTLRGWGLCGGVNNQLDVINIKNLLSPQLLKTYPLTAPRGLSKDGAILLICDGTDGLKIFDANNVSAITPIKTIGGFDAIDVIAYQGIAIVVATDGIYLVDYQTPADAKLVSKIQVSKN